MQDIFIYRSTPCLLHSAPPFHLSSLSNSLSKRLTKGEGSAPIPTLGQRHGKWLFRFPVAVHDGLMMARSPTAVPWLLRSLASRQW